MAWNNVYLKTPGPVGNLQGSRATTVFSGLSLTEDFQGTAVAATTGAFSSTISAAGAAIFRSTVSIVGQLDGAGATLTSTLSTTDSDFLSVQTAANASGMTTGQLRLIFANSGVSLMYSSGETSYTIGVSTVSVAQA